MEGGGKGLLGRQSTLVTTCIIDMNPDYSSEMQMASSSYYREKFKTQKCELAKGNGNSNGRVGP